MVHIILSVWRSEVSLSHTFKPFSPRLLFYTCSISCSSAVEIIAGKTAGSWSTAGFLSHQPHCAQRGDMHKNGSFTQSHENRSTVAEGSEGHRGKGSVWEFKDDIKLQSVFKILFYSSVMQSTSRRTGWGSTRESVSCSFPFALRHSLVSSGLAALKCSLKRWGCMWCIGTR